MPKVYIHQNLQAAFDEIHKMCARGATTDVTIRLRRGVPTLLRADVSWELKDGRAKLWSGTDPTGVGLVDRNRQPDGEDL